VPYCESNTILSEYPPGIKLNPLRCNRWTCLECCPKRKSRLKGEAYRGRPNTFITLTVNPEIGTSKDCRARSLVDAWRKVRRRAKKGWGNATVPFIAVFEETKAGEPHLHILCRTKWIPQDWLSDEMKREIGAPIVDIRRIKGRKQVASYVTKYVGKNPEKFPGCKRYWRSQDYILEKKPAYEDPLGTAKNRWFEKGLPSAIAKKASYGFYELLTFGEERQIEYWLQRIPLQGPKEDVPDAQTNLFVRRSSLTGASVLNGE